MNPEELQKTRTLGIFYGKEISLNSTKDELLDLIEFLNKKIKSLTTSLYEDLE